jgi:ubiquinone/menaquinone biosynthesis C-methylase UbiE
LQGRERVGRAGACRTEGSIEVVERRFAAVGHQSVPESDWRSEILEAQKPVEAAVSRYSTLAPVYELWARVTESRSRRRVLEIAEVRDGEAVLEVATGTGAQLVSLAQCNPSGRTVGIELSDGMLAQTRKRLQGAGLISVELVRGDALRLPFDDNSFDLLVNGYMLDLLMREDIPRALAEFKRVMRPAGRLVLSNMTGASDTVTACGTGFTRAGSTSRPTAEECSPHRSWPNSGSPRSAAST